MFTKKSAEAILDQFRIDSQKATNKFLQYADNFNRDDLASGLFQRSLEQFLPYVIGQEYAPTNIEQYCPHIFDLQWGAEKMTYVVESAYGKADFGLLTDDIPFADVGRAEEGIDVTTIRFGYRYTQEELESAMFSLKARLTTVGDSLIVSKQRAALQSLMELYHLTGCYGNTTKNLFGLFNNPYVDVYNETTITPLGTVTLAEIREWFLKLAKIVVQATRITDKPDSIKMSLDLATKLSSIRSASASDRTALDLIKEDLAPYGIVNFEIINEVSKAYLEERGFYSVGTNKELMLIYKNSQDVLERHVSPVMAMPLERELNEYQGFFRQRISSVLVKRPYKMLYVTYPNTL
jgi:hypothetical protein